MAKAMQVFDEQGFDLACRKIRMCLLRDEPGQALKVLAEFAKQPMVTPVTFETSVCEIGLSPELAAILQHAGYLNFGALRRASKKELQIITRERQDFLMEIQETLLRLKKFGKS